MNGEKPKHKHIKHQKQAAAGKRIIRIIHITHVVTILEGEIVRFGLQAYKLSKMPCCGRGQHYLFDL